MTEKISSIIDQPVTISGKEKISDKDKFGISRYEQALTEFIKRADTPLTIALQGEWGSGKTSLMNLLKYHLCEGEGAMYLSVWINTWQHSIMSDPEESIINILQSIIYQLGNASEGTFEDKRKRISPIIAKSVKIAGIGAANILGRAALGLSNIGSDLYATMQSCKEQSGVPENGNSKIAELRNDIAVLINEILAKEKGCRGFLFFIDDLDRIDPPVAVQILELLKNIFDLKHCIYILAIDYDVVVKGLKPKFGELTDKNAREFRSFFDKIIQLPFSMPVSSYKIDSFLIDAMSRIGYLTPEELKNEELKHRLSQMAMCSVGTNPRSLKRLTNILSLIQLMSEAEREANLNQQTPEEILLDKQVNFALVCLQIIYPLVYNTLLEYPNFLHWGDDNKDPNNDGKTLVKKLSLQELTEAEQKKLDKQGEDFDEPWERILFRICLKDNYLSSRVVDISRLLNQISSLIPSGEGHDEDVADIIDRLIRFSAVTNVHAAEDSIAKKIEDFNPSWWLKQFRDKFIPALNARLGGVDTVKYLNGHVQSKLRLQYQKLLQSGLTGAEAWIFMGHDEKSYHLCWVNGNSFLRGGFGSIEEEERLLGCAGLHDSLVSEIWKYAKVHPEIRLGIEDVYKGERKNGSFVVSARIYGDTLEALVSDEMINILADFVSSQLPIRLKMVQTELNALCWGHDDKLREQLKKIDLSPFTNMAQKGSQTYLQGYRLGGNNFGISLYLRSTGFQSIMWEGTKHDSGHNERLITDLMNAKPALRAIFSEHKDGESFWSHSEIIPFDEVIDWLKELQELLKSL